MSLKSFSSILRNWYALHKRDLPWRNTTDPYYIWLSEIILQQTRVAQGLPYYERFVENYPTIQDLANDSEENVLRLWQGLGYYSRARNLHATAKIVANELAGAFPNNYQSILKLKGVGPYTASAIASFAFNEKVSPIDGNVIRVVSRYFGIQEDVSQQATLAKIETFALKVLPVKDHQTHNQAMMEFGALQCVPSNPNCAECPLASSCEAYALNKVAQIPFKTRKIKKRDRFFYYVVIRHGKGVYLSKRGPKDIWTNLYEFYLSEQSSTVDSGVILDEVSSLIGAESYKFRSETGLKKHVLSHQNIYPVFLEIELFKELDLSNLGLEWCDEEKVQSLPKSILINNYMDTNNFS